MSPLSPSVFFSEYADRRYFHCQRDGEATPFDCFPVADVKRLLTFTNLDGFGFRLFKNGSVVPPDRYLGEQADSPGLRRIDPLSVMKEFKRGSTLVFERVHMYHKGLRTFCRQLEAETGLRFKANVYASPANSEGFKPHFDGHDVFVCQIHGSKVWRVAREITPAYRRAGVKGGAFVKDTGFAADSFTMAAGDFVYIPRGQVHAARTTQEISVHVAIGMLAPTLER